LLLLCVHLASFLIFLPFFAICLLVFSFLYFVWFGNGPSHAVEMASFVCMIMLFRFLLLLLSFLLLDLEMVRLMLCVSS
jgi:hypothetical protein